MASLPRFFVLTDSDLRLGDETPQNFLCVMAHALHRMPDIAKVGLALDLSDRSRMWQSFDYYREQSIWDYEASLWTRIEHGIPGFPQLSGVIYNSPVDTIFAIYDKTLLSCSNSTQLNPGGYHLVQIPCFSSNAVRLGGAFTAAHRPWYPEVFARFLPGEIEAYRGGGGTLFQMFLRAGWLSNLTASISNYLTDHPLPPLTVQEEEHTGGISNYVCRGLIFPRLGTTRFRAEAPENFEVAIDLQSQKCSISSAQFERLHNGKLEPFKSVDEVRQTFTAG